MSDPSPYDAQSRTGRLAVFAWSAILGLAGGLGTLAGLALADRRTGPEAGRAGLRRFHGPDPADIVVEPTWLDRSGPGALGVGVLVLCLAGLLGLAGWEIASASQRKERQAVIATGGIPARAAGHLVHYGCAGCHSVGSIGVPQGRVGPPLDDMGNRTYIAGRLRNTPDNMVRWIVDPKSVDPQTAMPVTGISPDEARDIVAWFKLNAS